MAPEHRARRNPDHTYFQRESGFHHGLYVGASAGSTVAVAGSALLGLVALWAGFMLSQTDF